MKQKTEVIFNDNCIESVDSIIPLNVGDKFYFSIRGTCPRSEKTYKENNAQFKEHFLDLVIEEINKKSKKYWIMEFVVSKVSNSYKRDYSFSIDDPDIEFIRSITVEEVKDKK